MATSEVVGGVLLAGDELLGVEELAVSSSSDFVNDGGLQVNKDGTGNVLSGTSLREEGVERVVSSSNGLVRGHLTIGLDAVLCDNELECEYKKRGNITYRGSKVPNRRYQFGHRLDRRG